MQRFAVQLLVLTASRERLSRPAVWVDRPAPPQSLGNMLQSLALKRPAAVLVLEHVVANMLDEIDQ